MSVDQRYPSDLPLWLADGHAFDAVPIAEEVRFEQGEDRQRQMRTWVPQIASVSALFSQSQYDRWVAFYEDELEAGTRPFDTQVASQSGTVLEWWTAQVVAPPMEITLHKGPPERANRYRVTLQLVLLDGPYDARTPASLRGRVTTTTRLEAVSGGLDTDGGGGGGTGAVLRGRVETVTTLTGLMGAPTLRGIDEVVTTLTGRFTGDNLLLESGDDLLLEDGSSLLLLEE